MKKPQEKGFTLIELMVVIVIVGILAAVAIPKFTMASHKAKASEFPTVLTSIYTAQGAYEAEEGTYASSLSDLDLTLDTDTKWFSYTLTSGGASAFTATASVKAPGFGDATAADNATIDQNGEKSATANLQKYAKSWSND
jgi:prepilin-type N-terminal cleavage/methylation domain-containing protein